MKRAVLGLVVVVVAILGYTGQASACHIVDAGLSAVCTNDGGQFSIDYALDVSTYPAGWTVDFELTITGASGPQIVTGSFPADTGPVQGSVLVPDSGTHSITGFVVLPSWDTWTLAPVVVECSGDSGEGCTPGFWKNHPGYWPPTGYDLNDDFDTVFGTDLFDPDITLNQAVRAQGGGVNRLARHGASALLNAAHPDVDYPLTVDEVIAAVQAGDADLLEYSNELGCPLGRGLFGGGNQFSSVSFG